MGWKCGLFIWLALSMEWGNQPKHWYIGASFPHSKGQLVMFHRISIYLLLSINHCIYMHVLQFWISDWFPQHSRDTLERNIHRLSPAVRSHLPTFDKLHGKLLQGAVECHVVPWSAESTHPHGSILSTILGLEDMKSKSQVEKDQEFQTLPAIMFHSSLVDCMPLPVPSAVLLSDPRGHTTCHSVLDRKTMKNIQCQSKLSFHSKSPQTKKTDEWLWMIFFRASSFDVFWKYQPFRQIHQVFVNVIRLSLSGNWKNLMYIGCQIFGSHEYLCSRC